MPLDAIATVLRVRRTALDEAKRGLAACLKDEDKAEAAARATERAIYDETAAAGALAADDAVMEAFAAWLPGARRRVEAAREMHERARADTARARAAVSAARSALEAAEVLQAERARVRAAEAERKQQLALDEAGRRREE